ncbi:hypothetical protein WMF20_41965 [Sorangium sp. So ce834]|uniref:hypothetical protein n=1 Tax=Sorangium sp. So ce834 TaxID=3133321 RepID=UPI003F61D6D4
MDEFVARFERVLNEVDLLGARWRGTRFDTYLQIMKEAASLTYPRPFPWEDEPEKKRLFFEASSQIQQLVDAADIWRDIDPKVAKEKVIAIMSGQPMPPSGVAEDRPRNTLLEFATATALKRKGFIVDMTSQDEDIIATYPGLKEFVVECKRPTHAGALERNLRKLRHQLQERGKQGARYGLAVLGIDRVLELPGKTPNAADFQRFDSILDMTLREQIQNVRRVDRGKLFPHAALGGVLVTTSVFLNDRGGLFTVSLMGLFCTGPEDHHTSMTIKYEIAKTIEMT